MQGRDSFKQGMVGIDLQPIPMPDNRAQFKQQPGYGAFHIKVRARYPSPEPKPKPEPEPKPESGMGVCLAVKLRLVKG